MSISRQKALGLVPFPDLLGPSPLELTLTRSGRNCHNSRQITPLESIPNLLSPLKLTLTKNAPARPDLRGERASPVTRTLPVAVGAPVPCRGAVTPRRSRGRVLCYYRLAARSFPSPAATEELMSRMLKIIGIVVVVLIVIVLVAPFLIPVNQFRPTIEEKASAALGRKVEVGNLSLSLISGSLSAENLSIGDDPKFSSSPFLTA